MSSVMGIGPCEAGRRPCREMTSIGPECPRRSSVLSTSSAIKPLPMMSAWSVGLPDSMAPFANGFSSRPGKSSLFAVRVVGSRSSGLPVARSSRVASSVLPPSRWICQMASRCSVWIALS